MNFGMEIEEEREEEEKNGRLMEESCLVKGRRERSPEAVRRGQSVSVGGEFTPEILDTINLYSQVRRTSYFLCGIYY